jgi:bifunctional enzyme CysN/CysC
MELLRFATAGSVDDGKSTLIGRLLHDSKSIFEDQLEAVERSSAQRGHDYVNLALLTDGLRAEREQGITIDVAYRYFATPKRKFIIADTPGHVQYTRNMVTGASTADLAIVLVDARKGMLEQSRRHAYIATLLGIPHLVVAINKMDLVDWDEVVFKDIAHQFSGFAAGLRPHEVKFIPMSALLGDNVVDRSANMPWYDGPALLEYLEEVELESSHNHADPRFPVQYVIRPLTEEHHDYRGYAGAVAGGVFRPGDDVVVLPSGRATTIEAIDTLDGEVAEAFAPMSVTVRLADHLDVSRGDMICRPHNLPRVTQELDAMLCWFSEQPMRPGTKYGIKHTTRSARAIVQLLAHRIDVDSLQPETRTSELDMNDIGRVSLKVSVPLMVDRYADNRATGSFILLEIGRAHV